MRKLFKFPQRTNNYIVCGIVEDITHKLHKGLAKYVYKLINTENNTAGSMLEVILCCESSVLQKIIDFLCIRIIFLCMHDVKNYHIY